MFTEAVEGLLTAAKIYEERKTIIQTSSRWISILCNGTTQVCVFGAGGTGKTTLGQFLSGKLDYNQSTTPYHETMSIEKVKMSGNIPALLSIVPGQESRKATTWPILFQDLMSGESTRVVNVVSAGYHASELEQSRHRVYRNGISEESFRSSYIKDSLDVETNGMRDLVPHLTNMPGKLNMLTIVTKQDLWWKDRHLVSDHYQKGDYHHALDQIRSGKGANNFTHNYISCSLIEQNLRLGDGFLIAPTTEGYDDSLRVANMHVTALAIESLLS